MEESFFPGNARSDMEEGKRKVLVVTRMTTRMKEEEYGYDLGARERQWSYQAQTSE